MPVIPLSSGTRARHCGGSGGGCVNPQNQIPNAFPEKKNVFNSFCQKQCQVLKNTQRLIHINKPTSKYHRQVEKVDLFLSFICSFDRFDTCQLESQRKESFVSSDSRNDDIWPPPSSKSATREHLEQSHFI